MTVPTDRQLTQLRVAFTRHGITDRGDVLRLSAEHAGRHLYSTRAMTGDEVDALIGRLGRVPVGVLPGHAARLHRDEEERARRAAAVERIPAGTKVCTPGGKPPTTGDLETVAEFAEFRTTPRRRPVRARDRRPPRPRHARRRRGQRPRRGQRGRCRRHRLTRPTAPAEELS